MYETKKPVRQNKKTGNLTKTATFMALFR